MAESPVSHAAEALRRLARNPAALNVLLVFLVGVLLGQELGRVSASLSGRTPVGRFLRANGLAEYAPRFAHKGYSRVDDLLLLTESDLDALGVPVKAHRMRILVNTLRVREREVAEASAAAHPPLVPLWAVAALAAAAALVYSPDLRYKLINTSVVGAIMTWYAGLLLKKRVDEHLAGAPAEDPDAGRARVGSEVAGRPRAGSSRSRAGSARDRAGSTVSQRPSIGEAEMSAKAESHPKIEEFLARDSPIVDTSKTDARRKLYALHKMLGGGELPEEMTGGDYGACLARFLSFKNWDTKKAYKQVRYAQKVRMELNVSAMLGFSDCPPEAIKVLEQYYNICYYGLDKKGQPLYVEATGRAKLKKVLDTFSVRDVLRLHGGQLEYLVRVMFPYASKVKGEAVDQYTTVLDLKGMDAWAFLATKVVDAFGKMMNTDQDVYPSLLDRCFIVNAPKLFSIVWPVAKKFLEKRVVERITLLGDLTANPELALELHAHCGVENLPTSLGGTREESITETMPWVIPADVQPFVDSALTVTAKPVLKKAATMPTRMPGAGAPGDASSV